MSERECIANFSKGLFWDVDVRQVNMDDCPSQIVQRVLEYGNLSDWRIICSYYGLDKIVNLCRNLRTLDAVALAFISGISGTPKECFRCYRTKQSNPTLWNC
ncbi:MAG: hypothetical protein IJ467_02755 [Bacteroidaceae bacterium]|nr:hypothetical protein [Bacteroidaceae bacterium]